MLRRCVVVALLALSPVALAQQVQIDVKPQFRRGEPVVISLTSPVAAARFEAALEHDGARVEVAHGPARAGERVQLRLPGAGHYEGNLAVTFRDGNRWSQDVKFDAVVAGGTMSVGYTKEHLDLSAHTLEFTMSRPAGRAELKVIADDGAEIATASATYKGEKPGTWLPIHWAPTRDANVLHLVLRATSSDGITVEATLTPWQVSIPHKEVVFETNKWDIRPSEEPKLDACYQRVVDEVAKARTAVPNVAVKLFVAGFTDTVGSNADNRKLSLERARAIASWFRDRGLPLPIYYAGFGEEVLRVKTADNTDSEANRRADYIVAFDEPMVARGVHATWMKLQ